MRRILLAVICITVAAQELPSERDRARRIERLVEITTHQPRDVGSWHDLADLYREAGDWEKAIAADSRAIEGHPKYAVAYYGRAKAAMGKRDFDGARADFSTAIGLWEARGGREKFLTVERPSEPYVDSYRTRAMAWANQGKYPEALADIDVAVQLRQDDPKLHWERAYLNEKARKPEATAGYLRAGLLYADSRRFDKANECIAALDRLKAGPQAAELRARIDKLRKPASDLP